MNALTGSRARHRVQVDYDFDNVGLNNRIQSAVETASRQRIQVQTEVDRDALRESLGDSVRQATVRERVRLEIDSDALMGGVRQSVRRAATAAGPELARAALGNNSTQINAAREAVRNLDTEVERVVQNNRGGILRRIFGSVGSGGGGLGPIDIFGGGSGGRGLLDARSGIGSLSLRGLMIMSTMAAPALGALIAPIRAVGLPSPSLVPAFLGIGMAAGSVIIGVQGVGTAMKASGTDAVKYGAALQNLAPNAQEFVQTATSMKGAFTGLRLQTQQALFAGLSQTLQSMGQTVMPALTGGFVGMAGVVNTALKDMGTTVTRLADTGILQAMFGGLKTAMTPLATVPGDIIESLSRISIAATPLLTRITTVISGAMSNFSDTITRQFDTGVLQMKIDRAGQSIGQFFTNFANNGAVVDFMSNMKQYGPDAAKNLTKIGEAGLQLVSSGSVVGATLLKSGWRSSHFINAVPPQALATVMGVAGGIKLLSLADRGIARVGTAMAGLGSSIVAVGSGGRAVGTTAANVGRLGTASARTAAVFGAGALSASNIRNVATSTAAAGGAAAGAASRWSRFAGAAKTMGLGMVVFSSVRALWRMS